MSSESKGALFSIYHDLVAYDIEFKNTRFENISMQFSFSNSSSGLNSTNSTVAVTKQPVSTILRTVQTRFKLKKKVADMNCNFTGSTFKDVYQEHTENITQQLFHFDYPINKLTLTSNKFIGIENHWDKLKNSTNHTQIMQSFDPKTGPQSVYIFNSTFGSELVNPNNTLLHNHIFNKTKALPNLNQSELVFFHFQNYNVTNQKHIKFQDIVIKNFAFTANQSSQISSVRKGTFTRVRNSIVEIENMHVSNLTSSGNGSLIQYIGLNDTAG